MISKWNHQQLTASLKISLATVFGIIAFAYPATASAQQRWRFDVKDHASDIQHLARDIRKEVLHDAKGSRQFGPLLAATGRLEGSAAVLRAWARHSGPLDLQKQLGKVDCAHKDLLRLVSEAKHDLHFHHGGFTCPRLDGLLGEVCDHITHAQGDIPVLHRHHQEVHHPVIHHEEVVVGRPRCGNGIGLHQQSVDIAPGPLSGHFGGGYQGGTVIRKETVVRSPGRKHTTVKKVYVANEPYRGRAYVDSRIQDYYRSRGNSRHYKSHQNRYGHHRNPYTRKHTGQRSKGVHLDGGGITIQGRNVGFRINF